MKKLLCSLYTARSVVDHAVMEMIALLPLHIMDAEDSLLKSLNQRQGAIKKICKVGSFKSRKMLANGVFMSKLIYLMPVWAGAEDYLIKAL